MRILILSDIHGNLEALRSIREAWDQLWVLGDLVNYGPNPCEVVEFVRQNASIVVRGNHDHAIGAGLDPRCSRAFRGMARQMQVYTESVLSPDQKAYLAGLPLTARAKADSDTFFLCHAAPSDPLFLYLPPDSPQWPAEAALVDTGTLLVGHTHVPFLLETVSCRIANPGSAGQPKHGTPAACYALWEDGELSLKSCPYHLDETVRKLLTLPVDKQVAQHLGEVLRRGAPPKS